MGKTAMAELKLNKITVHRKSKCIHISAVSCKLLPYSMLSGLEHYYRNCFGTDSISLFVRFETGLPLKESLEEYWGEIMAAAYGTMPSSKGILSGCSWNLENDTLKVSLANGGMHILENKKFSVWLEEIIDRLFGEKVRVFLDDSCHDTGNRKEYIEFKKDQEERVTREIQEEYLRSGSGTGTGNAVIQEGTAPSGYPVVLKGRDFNGEISEMKSITLDSGKIAVAGDIFSVKTRETRKKAIMCSLNITDDTSSINVKSFFSKKEFENIRTHIQEGNAVKVRGEIQYDSFTRDIVLMARDIVRIKGRKRMDTSPSRRVELHMHTRMSSMDAVSDASDLIKTAAEWGHKAIAITDHGVVQAFPDAYMAAKKHGIKLIFGMECYLLDDDMPVVYNLEGSETDGSFVVLDIETTGLSPRTDRITEIGAVKMVRGEITGSFHTLINPAIHIPKRITDITGIDDNMVADAPPIDQVIPEFVDFIGNSCIAAHNALFDMGFIRHALRNNGYDIANPVLDTLQMTRKMFPELKRHKLGSLAAHFKIDAGNSHRALDDARTACFVLTKCLNILTSKGADTLEGIEKELASKDGFKNARSYHAIILVKNSTGLRNLYRIVSDSHLKYFYKKPRVPKKLLMEYREGLLITTACESGELFAAIVENRSDRELERIADFYDLLEIQPLGNNRFLISGGRIQDNEALKDINRKIISLGEKLEKPVIATCDVHFLNPADEVYRRVLMAGQGYNDADRQASLYLRTTDEMLSEFEYLGEKKAFEVVVENTVKVSEMIEEIPPVPEGTFPPMIDGSDEQIRKLAEGRAKEIYGDLLPEVVSERLRKELDSIIKNNFSVMYIIAWKLVSKSLDDGYLVGSRGSVGSSFVANMAGITEVNSLPAHYICPECKYSEFITDGSYDCGFDLPDKECPKCGSRLDRDGYDIPFETFLGFDGDKEPDIDLNFSGEYQPVAHKYTEELFGEGHVFRAGTISTIASKTAYGFVRGYLDERGLNVTNAEVDRLVKGCSGIKRTTGQHPGGVMIVPHDREIYEFCPIQRPADDTGSDIVTTHFDYHSISGKLLKLDILGHDDPTVIKMLEDITGVDARTIPIGEKKTMGIFRSTEPIGVTPDDIDSEVGTFGIPEFGTGFVRQMLVDTKPTKFSELIRISGLSHGTDVWLNNAQELVRSETAPLSEVICTRDDIMLYLLHKGLPPATAFKIMEDVRKGRGLKGEYEKVMRDNRVPGWYIESCKKIKYMFPKAHAAAYVMMAFRIAWFKVYYPEAFYAAYFTVRADDFDASLMARGRERVQDKIREFKKLKDAGNGSMSQKDKNVLTILEVVNEMYARGFSFLPVDLYHSDARKFIIEEGGIRPPLNALQGLGAAAARNIIEAREKDEFISVEDLRIRAGISKPVIEILDENGCLDGLPESNQLSLF